MQHCKAMKNQGFFIRCSKQKIKNLQAANTKILILNDGSNEYKKRTDHIKFCSKSDQKF